MTAFMNIVTATGELFHTLISRIQYWALPQIPYELQRASLLAPLNKHHSPITNISTLMITVV
jgi:hypothetical protein